MAIELSRGNAGDVGDVVVVGKRLPRKCCAPKDASPALDEVQPSGADRDEGVLDPRMRGQPVADRATAVAGEIIRDEVEITVGIGTVKGLEQCEIARGVARRRGLGESLAVPDRQRAVDPDFVGASVVVQGHFDPVAVH
jgi:hypothetical protein